MNVKFIQTGNAIDYTPATDVVAGDVIVQGDLVGVAKLDIKAGVLGALVVAGIFDFPKIASAISTGTKLYWDAGNKRATTTAGSNKLIGKSIRDAIDTDPMVRILMTQ